MKTDWMIDEPIDFEYQKYKMLGYFQKMAQVIGLPSDSPQVKKAYVLQ